MSPYPMDADMHSVLYQLEKFAKGFHKSEYDCNTCSHRNSHPHFMAFLLTKVNHVAVQDVDGLYIVFKGYPIYLYICFTAITRAGLLKKHFFFSIYCS